MTCDESRLLLQAYLDDELDAAQSASIAQHLACCAACAARYGADTRLRRALAQPGLYHRAPDALRARWLAARPAAAPARARRGPLGLALAAGFAGALLLTSPAWLGLLHPPGQAADALAAQAISGHLRSLQPDHLMDVASTDRHTVKPWFEGRLDFAPRVKDLAGEGFPLVGGRLDVIGGRTVAALVYRRHLHVINLFQWPDDRALHASETVQQHGYTALGWSDGGMRYIAVSDVEQGELEQFARDLRDPDAGSR
jgi:mycothiol system anti-sigma-R factor